jgi:mono/diheme cytochrome c family protein
VTLALLAAGCAGPAMPAGPTALPTPDPTAAWQALGAAVYARECAACHGPQGEGQPNWAVALPDGSLPAPPHDASGHTWHHADPQLLEIIERGGTIYLPTSKMPAFGDKLSADERRAVLAHLKTFWGPRELEYQAGVTMQWAAEHAGTGPAAGTATP